MSTVNHEDCLPSELREVARGVVECVLYAKQEAFIAVYVGSYISSRNGPTLFDGFLESREFNTGSTRGKHMGRNPYLLDQETGIKDCLLYAACIRVEGILR